MTTTLNKYFLLTATLAIFATTAYSQRVHNFDGRDRNVITTAVPFLTITPDSRAGGMGDVGAATTPDASSTHWNPAKLVFVEPKFGGGLSYVPWLRALVPDINLSYLSGYYRPDDMQAFGMELRYFSLGDIAFTNTFGHELMTFRPHEFSIAGSYARKLSDDFSVGLGIRFIHSNLAGNFDGGAGGPTAKPASSVAGDISAYYRTDASIFGQEGVLAFGGNISNIGAKVTYTDAFNRDFIPTNLRLGTSFTTEIDDYNSIMVAIDLNKLLIPTDPIYLYDSAGIVIGPDGEPEIEKGMDPNVPVIQGMFQSFYDAPGGFGEELREINPSIGIEYWYDQQFALRTGYFYEHPTKGNRQYLTLGAGLKYNVFSFDFAYLISTGARTASQESPLANTMRFSLLFNFAEEKQERTPRQRTN